MEQPTVRADILGKLLLIQETLDVLPDSAGIAAFLQRALSEIPGIVDMHLYVEGVSYPPSKEFDKVCAEYEAAWSTSSACLDHPVGTDLWVFIPLRSSHHLYGKLILSINDKDAFSPYRAFVQNIANVVATTLDTRKYIRQLDESRADLESQVVERTATLKESQESLRKSEERWKFALEGAGDGVWDWNPKTDEALFSKRWKEMIDYAEHEFPNTGAAWIEHMHPDDVDRVLSTVQEYFSGSQSFYAVEFRMRCKDNSWKWILARGMLVNRDVDGNPLRMIGTHTDITERKHADQVLQRESEKNLAFLRNASDGIHILDSGGNIIDVSNSFCEMLGYRRDEMIGMNFSQWDAKFTVTELNQLISQQITQNKRSRFETRHRRKNGALLDVEITNCPFELEGKTVLFNASRDITERKQIEEALHQAATVFESSHDGSIITDLAGCILAVNKAYLDITGYSEAEFLGQNPRILNSGRQSRDFYQSMWASIKEAGYWQGEIWNRRKSGELYPERLTISAVKNASGETTHYVGMSSDLSQIKQSETQLEHLAHFDPLTDMPNRLLVQSHLTHALSQAQRLRRQVGVLYLDLDRFKNINESLGYPVGDELLVNLTKRLSSRMRSEDMLARLGGDEFLIVMEHMEGPEDAAGVAQSLLELLTQPFDLSDEQKVFIGASIGISIFPDDGNSANQLIQHADAAMHQAKNQGRNTYSFYTDSLTRAANEHLELETRLRHAITANQFRVYYQPQVDIATGHIFGAEALVRWLDPERGLIQPVHFIPLAEETGLIGAIGEWVLRETCLQGVRWIKAGLPFLTLAVNLSPHQFMRGNIAEQVSAVLAETGFPSYRLELELTESALMEREEDAVKMLHLLRAQNIRLAIDDFGTGYSSLSYLKRFPLDILKIDKSFVDDIPFHQDDMEIAATIIAMGHTLGFKVLAEGVETAEQLAFLQAKGCDMYQGYLTSPPVTAEEFEKLLKKK